MDKIIDIHTHILPGVDDGCRTIEDSIEVIKYLKGNGVTDIVLTSHYIENSNYSYNQISRSEIFTRLKEKTQDLEVNLYLGNEIYLSDNVINLLERHEISTINNTKYMLVELPLTGYLNNLQNILCDLTSYGIVPIIAHPERYDFLQKNFKRVRELLEFDCLIQCNIDSLTGKYGRSAKRLMKKLLKNNLVQFVATDTHYVGSSDDLNKAYNKLKKIVGNDKYKQLTCTNSEIVLKNGEVFGNLEYLIREENRKK